MDVIAKYFQSLTSEQFQQFQQLEGLYREWNAKINLISRQDIEHLYEHHVLHSLAIAKVFHFNDGAEILDIGTGGGFPGIPLAILLPKVRFHLIDGTLKKIKVVQDLIEKLNLKNATAEQVRAEELKNRRFDFVVTRAVTELLLIKTWSARLLKNQHRYATPNGLIALKGGKVQGEIAALQKGEYAEAHPISDFFEEEYFEGKYVVYVQG